MGSVVLKANGRYYYILYQYDEYQKHVSYPEPLGELVDQ
jgi:hypothetical protein